ncbi:MAG: LPS assembly protein LptD, partial [Acidobacteria bacterium]|nr:LPS assembly protein LptD [Acidobacteriota bacterium]
LSFKIGRVSVFYSPYLVCPIKTDRASGLLFPEFGFSQRAGTVISNAFYWAMRRNMDATIHLDYFSEAGYGTGLEYRMLPNDRGKLFFTGYFIRDQVVKEEMPPDVDVSRWVIDFGQTQDFGAGWRLVAKANFISDFDYYRDYERDFRLSTTPEARSNLLLTRTWGFFAFNVRGERREQIVNERITAMAIGDPIAITDENVVVRWTRPDIELRGRRQRLGRTPFYLTMQSSVSSFTKGEVDADYERFHFAPTVSSQISPLTWLDVDASVGLESSYYSKSQDDDLGCDNLPNTGDQGEGSGRKESEKDVDGNGVFDVGDDLGCMNTNTADPGFIFGLNNGQFDEERETILDRSINLNVLRGRLEVIGPKMSRIFNTPASEFSPQYKHTIEPTLRYNYRTDAKDADKVIRFDEIDSFTGKASQVTYALVSRLYAKRPPGGVARFGAPGGWGGSGAGTSSLAAAAAAVIKREEDEQGIITRPGEKPRKEKEKLSTVEIATFEIAQDYSFLRPISISPTLGESKRVSPVRASLRINPSNHTSLDLRTKFDVIFRQFSEASLSASLRSTQRGFLDFTYSLIRDLEGRAAFESGTSISAGQIFDRSQIGMQAETNLFDRRVLLGAQINYELGDVLPGEPRLRDQRYRFGYNTQCCGFQFEYLNRNFSGSSQTEFRFLINLKGIGNVIDMHAGAGSGF